MNSINSRIRVKSNALCIASRILQEPWLGSIETEYGTKSLILGRAQPIISNDESRRESSFDYYKLLQLFKKSRGK